MLSRGDVRQALERVAVVWPLLSSRDAMRQEIGESIMGYSEVLEPSDLDAGVSLLIKMHPTAAKDGGPAWPPGPNEVTGCVLKARQERLERAPRPPEEERVGPREVIGRHCHRCKSALLYLPPERLLYCDGCRSVQVIERSEGHMRRALNFTESAALVFADEP